MTIEVEDIDSCTKKIKFAIPHQDYKKRVDAQLKRVAGTVQVPGFRKGKAPRAMLEKQYGPEVKREVLTQLISERVTGAIQEKGLRAVSPPSLLDVQAEEGADISVSAQVEVLPEVAVKDYSGLELEMSVFNVADKEVDDVIEHYRQRHAKSVPVSGRPVQDQDVIKIDFRGTIDGKSFEGGEAKDYVFQVGSKGTLPGFEQHLLGMELGGEKDFQFTFPEDYPRKEIAGQTANFHVALKEIHYRIVPEVDDEFARTADPNKKYETLLDMRVKIREELEAYEKKEARKQAKNRLAEKLAEMNPVDVPESLVHEQIRFMVKEEKKKAGTAGKTPGGDEYGEPLPVSPEEETQYRAKAVKILQQELVIGQLAEELGVEIEPGEIDRELQQFTALAGGGRVGDLKKEWQKNGMLDKLASRMKREKTLETLMAKVKLKEEMVDRPAQTDHN